MNKIYFEDRVDAAKKLIDILPIDTMKLEDWTVVSISAGGIPIAKMISQELNSSFEYMFTEKIVAPMNDECEIAIVTESEEVIIHEELAKSFEIDLDYIFSKSNDIYEEKILDQIKNFRSNKKISDLEGKNVLLVDEGLNTGLTMMACIKTAINLGAKSVSVATPILPEVTVLDIESIADDLYYVKKLPHFIAINFYYEKLEELKYEKIN